MQNFVSSKGVFKKKNLKSDFKSRTAIQLNQKMG